MLKISFIDLLKVFLFAGLRRGEKEHKTNPLLITLTDSQLTAFSKCSQVWSPDFWCKKLSYFKLKNTVKKSTFKNTGNEVQESNESSSRYFARPGGGTLLWPFDSSRHTPILTPVRILVIHSVLKPHSEALSWEDWSTSWNTGCAVLLVVTGSREVWPEGSCSGLTPRKRILDSGVCNGKLCNTMLVLRGLWVFSCFTTKLSIEILRFLELRLAVFVALLSLKGSVALFMVESGTGTRTASACWTEC